jgi:hypothetical protein
VPRDALSVEVLGERFRFYFDRPGLLHITAAHGTTPVEAIETFFKAETTLWDERHLRFESLSASHGLFWTRHGHDGAVIIISCWRRREEDAPEAN